MNSSKVIIVKQKWDEDSHFSKVKRVFFSEDRATEYIDEEKTKPHNDGCFWIISDREIEDYEPCLSQEDIDMSNIYAKQELIETILSDWSKMDNKISLENYLDRLWGALELDLIRYEAE